MKKDAFTLRHAALASALAMVMGATPAFADEALPEAPVAEVTAPPAEVPVAAVEPAVPADETPAVDPVAVDEPTAGAVDAGADGEVTVQVDEPAAEPVAVDEPAPVDECGMMCWNVADIPPEAVQKGGEEVDPQILQFEAPEPTLNVSTELSGAMGVSEQLGAATAELHDEASVEPLSADIAAPAAVTTANAGTVNVIRDGHLR